MKSSKKIFVSVIAGAVILFLLAAAFVFSLPYLIDMEPVKERILTKLSQEIGGQVRFENLDLSYFPKPRVVIHQAAISIPGSVTGKLQSVEISPALLALLRGKLYISRILARSPEFSIAIPEATKKTGKTMSSNPLKETGRILSQISAVITSHLPNLTVIVKDGRLHLQRESKPPLSFSGINGRLTGPPGNFEVNITCGSTLWEKLSFKTTIDPVNFKGQGRIDLTDSQPHRLANFISAQSLSGITDSRLSLNLSFEADGLETLQAEFEGSLPLLAFHQKSKDVVIKGKSFKGGLQMKGDRIDISLQRINLTYPQLELAGKFQMDEKTPAYVLEVGGREIDVVSTREVALTLAGKLPITKTIFGIVRGGRVPVITFLSKGRSVADLDDTENFSLKGNLVDGKISISGEDFGPKGIDINLGSVIGSVVISKGLLDVKNLSARWENNQLREGMMRVGLEGEDVPFHLDVIADADLSSLPPLLHHLIREKTFQQELVRIHDLKGRALGRIVLGETTGSLRTKVEIREINLMARYDRIPYPVEIDRGQFSLVEEKISLRDLRGKIGGSTFFGLEAHLEVDKKQNLEVLSGNLSLDLGELYPWLSSVEAARTAFKDVTSIKGALHLKTVKLGGPASRPGDWQFEADGELSDVEVNAGSLPGPFTVKKGNFKATQKELSLDNVQTRLLDASFNASGSLHGYLQGIEKGDLDIHGSMTPTDIRQFSTLLGVKNKVPVRSPLSVSQGHLSWTKTGDVSFKGDIAVKEGPLLSLDILRGTDWLKVNRLRVKDAVSQVDMTFDLYRRTLGVTFSGELSERTLDKIFEGYQFEDGWARGNFRANVDLDQPMQSTAEGKINVHDLTFPWQLKKPLEISEISLEARKNRFSVVSGTLTWGKERFDLSGDVTFPNKKINLDIDLSAGNIDVEELEEAFGKGKKGAERESELSVEGIIRLRSESLKFKQYTWTPFIADISFGGGGAEVAVKKASLCGMDTPGVVKVIDKKVSLNIEPLFKGKEIESAFRCLLNHEVRATGNFEFHGKFLAQGRPEDLFNSAEGDIEFHAKEGRIDYLLGLVRILEFLNVMEIYRGRLPDLKKEGLPYDRITIRGTLQKGKMIIKEFTIDGPTLEMTSQGEIDLADRKIDFTVLVAPLKTVDRVVKAIPLVSDIFAGTLVTIPVKVHGDLKDPRVTPLSPSAVGAELLAIMKRTLGLPFKILQPLLPSEKENK
jgi:uncharacterized protein involved in outer membrane biogenesis